MKGHSGPYSLLRSYGIELGRWIEE